MSISEKDFAQQVVDLARVYGWRTYRTWLSMRSPKGFPDLVLVRPPLLIFAELKSETGTFTPEQEAWLGDLSEITGVLVCRWRPSMFDTIHRILARDAEGKGGSESRGRAEAAVT